MTRIQRGLPQSIAHVILNSHWTQKDLVRSIELNFSGRILIPTSKKGLNSKVKLWKPFTVPSPTPPSIIEAHILALFKRNLKFRHFSRGHCLFYSPMLKPEHFNIDIRYAKMLQEDYTREADMPTI